MVVVFYAIFKTHVRQFYIPRGIELGITENQPVYLGPYLQSFSPTGISSVPLNPQPVEAEFLPEPALKTQPIPVGHSSMAMNPAPVNGESTPKPNKSGFGRGCLPLLKIVVGVFFLLVGLFQTWFADPVGGG